MKIRGDDGQSRPSFVACEIANSGNLVVSVSDVGLYPKNIDCRNTIALQQPDIILMIQNELNAVLPRLFVNRWRILGGQ